MFLLADQILLFVSAGKNTEGNPLEVIRDENEALQNRVIINTYGTGTGRCIEAELKHIHVRVYMCIGKGKMG